MTRLLVALVNAACWLPMDVAKTLARAGRRPTTAAVVDALTREENQ